MGTIMVGTGDRSIIGVHSIEHPHNGLAHVTFALVTPPDTTSGEPSHVLGKVLCVVHFDPAIPIDYNKIVDTAARKTRADFKRIADDLQSLMSTS